MANYMIDSGDGNWLANGGQAAGPPCAPGPDRLADERGETVTLYESPMPQDDDGENIGHSEDVEPSEVTDEQIQALRSEAAEAGDDAQVNMCDLALSPRGTWHAIDEAGHADDGKILTRDTARAECERVIRAARAQE